MKGPYIGVSDFANSSQVQKMLDVFKNRNGAVLGRKLMAGVMMNRKTLNSIPTKWDKVFPPRETISDIFIPHSLVFNTLHYADYDSVDVFENLESATTFAGPNLHALQLDMIWPSPAVISKYRDRHQDVQIVLQVSTKALEQVSDNARTLVTSLEKYGDTIDYVLLDRSMGRGLGLDAQALFPFVGAVKERIPQLGVAVAGGLGPDTLHLVEPLVREFSGLSIDAQGKLRPSGSALDPIDWDMAALYIERALKMFLQNEALS